MRPKASSGWAMLSATRRRGFSAESGSWKIIWKRARSGRSAASPSAVMSRPSKRIEPAVGRSRRSSVRPSKVLPEPALADHRHRLAAADVEIDAARISISGARRNGRCAARLGSESQAAHSSVGGAALHHRPLASARRRSVNAAGTGTSASAGRS